MSIPNPYTAAHNAFSHGTDNTQNLVTDTAYNARGLVRKQIDVLGNVTLFGYNDAGRLIKTVQNASQPNYNNDYSGTSPDPDLSAYAPNSNADQDLITANEYDAAGNLVKTIDVLGIATFTVYDALNRPVKVVRSAKAAATIALNPGDVGYDATNDPRSASYVPSADPDRDLIDTTEYDAMGRVIRTSRLLDNRPTALWDTTLYGYDPLGRQVKVIQHASQPSYNIAADPDLSVYSASSATDQDMVTKTVYNEKGQVLYTEDALGARTWFKYDGLGRQVKTIANAVGTATDGSSNDPRSDSYVPSTDSDKDLISRTVYNSDGQVESTEDPLGRKTRFVYDSLGRRTRTITNFVDQGENPANWVWNNGWKKSDDTTPIAHGTDQDQNIISSTVYDAQGRVAQTLDHRNNITQFVYDVLGRQVKTIATYVPQGASNPANWIWDTGDNRWEDGAGNAISFGADNDQNAINATTYDLAGRVIRIRDTAGVETRYSYDAAGRRTQTIANYLDGVFSSAAPDEDLISTVSYNKAGQVLSTTDVRGTQTTFGYDAAGRQRTVTQAANTPLTVISYTSYDKAGRVLRSIQNWANDPTQPNPDAKDGSGNWLFMPLNNGTNNDRDLVTVFEYDLAHRQTKATDPVGNFSTTAYFKDGQVQSLTDPEGMVTQYRYDGVRRRILVVQGYADQGSSDPSSWTWDATDNRWEYPTNNPIAHGTDNDQNIIVLVTYDKAGRMTSLRDPRGNLTTYAYDQLNRRKTLTNPLSQAWTTAYENLITGGTRTTLTNPNGATHQVQREFDRMGRLKTIQYLNESPKNTPDVKFTYNVAGNRTAISEYTGAGFTNRIRETQYSYDDVRRLTSVGFDNDGSGSVDQTVSYEYDAGGLRTKLTLPGNLNVTYSYDARGRLVSLTDWDEQTTAFMHDKANRLFATLRANGLRSRYFYDPANRLRWLRHTRNRKPIGHFAYEVDRRGNRVQALEVLAHPATTSDSFITFDDDQVMYKGGWSDDDPFKVTTDTSASLRFIFMVNLEASGQPEFTFGTGPDHGIFDVYVGGTLWQSFDGYVASASERTVPLKLADEGPLTVEIRVRREKNRASSGYKVRFKQFFVPDSFAFDLHTIRYQYDWLSRLLNADYHVGANVSGTPFRAYEYAYDLAGNRLSESLSIDGGTPTLTTYTYNAANQISNAGFTYDNNGNLTSDGTNTYVWDRANRLLSMGSSSYAYDGVGNRIKRTVGTDVTQYLLDLQPGLSVVLTATDDTDVTRYVHGPKGIYAQQSPVGAWSWMMQDGLGSARSVADNALNVLWTGTTEPYGEYSNDSGPRQSPYLFTGEYTDPNDLLYLRARYYHQTLGVFLSQDLVENLNRYRYASNNPVNRVDHNGLQDVYTGCQLTLTGMGYQYVCNGSQTPNSLTGINTFTNSGNQFNPNLQVFGDMNQFGFQTNNLNLGFETNQFGLQTNNLDYSLVPDFTTATDTISLADIEFSAGVGVRGRERGRGLPGGIEEILAKLAGCLGELLKLLQLLDSLSRLFDRTRTQERDRNSCEGNGYEFVGYHGSSSYSTNSLFGGIRRQSGTNFGGNQLGDGFYVTAFDAAVYFASWAVGNNPGSFPIILRVCVNLPRFSGGKKKRQVH